MDLLTLLLEKKLADHLRFPETISASWLAEGVLQLIPDKRKNRSLVVSVGIHGNETAPIEILIQLLAQLADGTLTLENNLLIIFGNLPAIRANRRYLHNDLNRMFGGRYLNFPLGNERSRAAELENVVSRFFAEPSVSATNIRWHIDLHTAIRASHHEQFALLPAQGRPFSAEFMQWLSDSNIEALVYHKEKGGTFSHFLGEKFGTDSCTMEIGKVMPFGKNDLKRFQKVIEALHGLIDHSQITARTKPELKHYQVVDSIIKSDDSFQLHIPADTMNFTELPAGFEIASQRDRHWKITSSVNFILFPNAEVANGLRAGLLLALNKKNN
ncbi:MULTISPECIES: succinylglutamate desuccinylase [Photorhabdus]|uniref:Succinylglutamate desuccinylase n=2 Tax=Photorhabdus asymbiotica TaxID=291112 RepID=B6VKL9_PHOAA|nr:succinylglutamate desuccinylase [Photorhabdus asymbiotica]RKS66472.1 succinylglutamate desuccinylase [Photorhabdus asymbiotica]CAQ83593.1 succinylglutamate desuccinylase [Photorhabdus asymbiotica]CAR66699.1 succinylglutamate desuccinylase (ec 3.1.-.-) [Photorhabdus asymbiotica subsp. asymbiotica ATCC 43949]